MICSGASPKELVLQPRKKQGAEHWSLPRATPKSGFVSSESAGLSMGRKVRYKPHYSGPKQVWFGVSFYHCHTQSCRNCWWERISTNITYIQKKKRFKKIKCPTAISGLRVQTFNSAPPASVTFLDGLCFLKGFQASPLHKSKARGDMKNLSLQRAHQVQDTPWDISVPVINWSPRRTFHKLF